MTDLRIARDLALPLDAVTQAIAILARRGAGKTYTATVLVEEVIGAGAPVVVLDPTGAWWGLRSSADGQKPGLPVVILGGEHGDVPLERTAGKVIADVVIDHPGAYVVDLSGFESNQAQDDFAADFLERLYRAKAQRRDALLLVVDEADSFAPQRPGPRQLRMLGALEAIVRRGRIRGLGVVLISQRAAILNKNVLTQCEVLIALQTTGPQDRAAIDDWVKGNGTPEEREAVMGSLASLERGEAWVWSPSWLRILQRVRIRTRKTFDSSATPEAGTVAIAPTARAAVDLDSLGKRIAETREQAKANDPAELRRQIRELERAAAAVPPPAEPEVRIERVEVPVLNGQVEKLADVVGRLSTVAMAIGDLGKDIGGIASELVAAIGRVEAPERPGTAVATKVAPVPAPRPVAPARPAPQLPAAPSEAGPLGRAERLILAALAQYRDTTRTQTQVAILTGYAVNGGGFRNALGRLRTLGLVVGGKNDLQVTAEGLAAAGDVAPLPTGRALLDHWLGQLGKAERLALEALASVYPDSLTQEDLGARTGYESTGGGFRNALGKLRTLELISGGKDALRASADLVDA